MYVQGFRMQVLRTWAVPPPHWGTLQNLMGGDLRENGVWGEGGALTAVEKYL